MEDNNFPVTTKNANRSCDDSEQGKKEVSSEVK